MARCSPMGVIKQCLAYKSAVTHCSKPAASAAVETVGLSSPSEQTGGLVFSKPHAGATHSGPLLRTELTYVETS